MSIFGCTEPAVVNATVREADDDDIHIECRFADGQKFAAVKVAAGFEELAHSIAAFLSSNVATRANGVPWIVFYGNYFPREIDSTWWTQADAQVRAAELNDATDERGIALYPMSWNVESA